MGLRFSQAAPSKSYNIKLSTIIENSGITLYDRMSDNLKYVTSALDAMPDIVARYTVSKDFTVNTVSRKGRMLADAKIVIRPTNGFVLEQIKTNVQNHKLERAVQGEDGHIVLEPDRQTFKSLADYERAKAAYLGGRKIS